MFNLLKSYFYNPAKGFDPISAKYALNYFNQSVNKRQFDENLANYFFSVLNDTSNKSILDLGGGPGLYSLLFAKKGLKVKWFDISNNYKTLSEKNAYQNGVEFEHEIGYLDNFTGKYDIIFNRVCWYYCFDDFTFLNKIVNNLNPNGVFFGVLHNENRIPKVNGIKTFLINLLYHLNNRLGIKIGHPPTSKKKISRMFNTVNFSKIIIENWGVDTLVIAYK